MKIDLQIYLARPGRGRYVASAPWLPELAEPVQGTSPAKLREEMLFRALELAHEHLDPGDFDRLVAPDDLTLTSVYLAPNWRPDPGKAPVESTVVTHVLVGRWAGENLRHIWLPRIPGLCMALPEPERLHELLTHRVEQWAEERRLDVEGLERIACPYHGQLASIEADPGFPSPRRGEASEEEAGRGRLRRPTTLHEVATNLIHRADDGHLPGASGREGLVDSLIEAMTASRPEHICLVGPSGVGKTATLYEAVRQVFGMQRSYQQRRDVWETSGDRIVAGMSIIGQWEKRVARMCDELVARDDILVLDDLLGVVRAGVSYGDDAGVARFLEPYLAQDRFAVIAEATEESYAAARAVAPGFVENFRRLPVPEMSHRETIGVVADLARQIEADETVYFAPDGIEAILGLTRRFERREAFPGKAVRLMRRCQQSAWRRLRSEGYDEDIMRIDPAFVAGVMQRETGLPATLLEPEVGRNTAEIEEAITSRVFAQPEAHEAVVRLVTRVEQGLCDPRRPLGSMMFVGPSGVGKTETARALADDLFGGVERMIRFDMSEFSEPTAATRLIGTRERPDGELTGRVRLQPFCLLLFDEIEKAHQSVLDLLLQILGDGRLTDAAGRTVDFTNAIVVMTSNLGADIEGRAVGFSEQNRSDRAQHYRRAAESFFRPELFNRIDTIVPYRPLGSGALRRIARRTLDELLERRGLRRARVLVDVDDELVDRMVRDAVDPRYGARTLARHIERRLVTPLARGLTTHDASGALTRVSVTPDGEEAPVSVDFIDIERAPPRPAPPDRRPEALEPRALIARFERVREQLALLESGARALEIEREYDEILARFGDGGDDGGDAGWSGADADRLRRREAFLSRRDALRSALDDFLVPDESGALELPALGERDRAAGRRWAERLVDFEDQLCWLRLQLEDLRRDDRDASRGAVLVSTAVADPQRVLLGAWRGRLRALDELFELDAIAAVRRLERWEPFDLSADLPGDARALAIATTVPAAPRLFEMICGYVWRPGPPPQRRHALVLHEVLEDAAHQTKDLLGLLEESGPRGRHGGGDGAAPRVEFEVVDSSLRDLREGTTVAVGGSPALIAETTRELLYPRLMRAAELPPAEAGDGEGHEEPASDARERP